MAEIVLSNVSLNYLVYHPRSRSIKSTILRNTIGGKLKHRGESFSEIAALENINLDLKKGTRLALLGHNGSGKTSLLRCMAGIYSPSSGFIRKNGKTEILIDPYTGLNHETTGRQNIYSLGHSRGYDRDYISKFENDVIRFSELGEFIDLPIRTFSMGMVSRLSFSLLVHLSPEIMLIDEAIGAGDADFQKKSAIKFKEHLASVDILVLSTHSLELAKLYCTNFVTLKKGKIVEHGSF